MQIKQATLKLINYQYDINFNIYQDRKTNLIRYFLISKYYY